MRTTIDLPADLHRIVSAIARDREQTLSQAASALMRRGLEHQRSSLKISARTGLPVVTFGGIVTSDDVRALDADEDSALDAHLVTHAKLDAS